MALLHSLHPPEYPPALIVYLTLFHILHYHTLRLYFFRCEQGRNLWVGVCFSVQLPHLYLFVKIKAVYFNKTIFNIAIYSMSALHTRCNSAIHPPRGANTKSVHQVVHLKQPVVFLNTREEWNFSLWSSSKVELLHPEWGMITVLVRVVKASRMIVILTASHDDRFHSTPAGDDMGVEKTGMQTSGYVSCHVQLG